MAQRGGKRPGAGRPKGRKDKATIEQRMTLEQMARTHTEAALSALVQIATAGESESARVSAANAILDRGYGKPPQSLEHAGPNGGPIPFARIERVVIDPSDPDAEGISPASETGEV